MHPKIIQARILMEENDTKQSIGQDVSIIDPESIVFFTPNGDDSFVEGIARRLRLQHKTVKLSVGHLHVLATENIDATKMSSLVDEYTGRYNALRGRLATIFHSPLKESSLHFSTDARERSNATEQFPARIINQKKPATKRKSVETKIDEALDGLAVADDQIQPQDGLKSLFAAMKESGLDIALKKKGVKWHIAEPGKQSVTFIKDGTPILQLSPLELGDPKTLGDTLSQLVSIAQGKAPQAAEQELEQAKMAAAKANERKKALDGVAQQFAKPPEAEKPQVQVRV